MSANRLFPRLFETQPAEVSRVATLLEQSRYLADQDVATLKEMKLYLLERLSELVSDDIDARQYREMLSGVEAELEARGRRRDAEYRACFYRTIALLTCIGTLLFNAGCATNQFADDRTALDFASKGARNAQLGMTALIALDTAQTVTIARSPDCLYEGNKIASTIFGSESPSPQRVLITNALYITAHWMLGSFLDRKAETINFDDLEHDEARRKTWKIARALYQGLTIVGHGAAVANNANQGIDPFSRYRCGM